MYEHYFFIFTLNIGLNLVFSTVVNNTIEEWKRERERERERSNKQHGVYKMEKFNYFI